LAKAREKFREIWQRRQDGAQGEVMDGKPSHGQDNG
jgi:hypothetical protein